MAARKFSAEFWKKASEPPFFSPPPLFREASSVAAVSEAAAKSGMYIGVFHIGEVDDAEAAVRGQLALFAVLAVLVEEVSCQCRELVVIDHHGKTFG